MQTDLDATTGATRQAFADAASGPPSLKRLRPNPRAWYASLAAAIADALAERRVALLVPFAMMAGCLAYLAVPVEPAFSAVIGLLALLAALHAILLIRGVFRPGLLLAVSAALGLALLPIHAALFGTPMLRGTAYGTYRAEVTDIVSQSAGLQRLVISHIAPVDGRDPHIRRARLFVRNGPELAIGDRLSGPIRFAEVPGPAVPGGFDAQFQSYFDGIGAYASSTRPPHIVAPGTPGPLDLSGLRHTIGLRIDAALAQPERGIARALIVGDQSQIGDETRATMAAAGLAHILAISGLHLTLVAGAVFAAIRLAMAAIPPIAHRVPAKPVAAAIGILVAFAYLGLSGASVSAIRATIMLTLVFGAVLFGRQALTMRNVAIAAIIVLILDPAGLFRPSFQLSFAAVAALVGIYEMRREVFPEAPGRFAWLRRLLIGTAVTSLVAGLATAVFAAYHFQQTAPLGVLGNIAALPIAAFVVLPMGLLSVLLMPFGLDPLTLTVMGWGISAILAVAAPIAEASRGLVTAPVLTSNALLVATVAIGWFAFFRTRIRFLAPALAIPAIALFCLARPPDVLVSDTTLGVAVRTAGGLGMATGRASSFVARIWSETYGEPIAEMSDATLCDPLGCVATLPNKQQVSIIRNEAAFAEDCAEADLVIARIPAPGWCRGQTEVIDSADMARNGVMALRWNTGNARFDIEPAIRDPDRPWRVPAR